MNTANERFKQLRTTCGFTQTEFGEIIGITKNGICDIEAGRRNVTKKHLIALKNYKGRAINTDWILTGEGNMFLHRTTGEEIMKFASTLMEQSDDDFKKRFVHALSKLEPSDWSVLQKIIDSMH